MADDNMIRDDQQDMELEYHQRDVHLKEDKFNIPQTGDFKRACKSVNVDVCPPAQTVESLLVDRSLQRMFNVRTVARELDVKQDEQKYIFARKNQELIALKVSTVDLIHCVLLVIFFCSFSI